jgi:hypothetical protein
LPKFCIFAICKEFFYFLRIANFFNAFRPSFVPAFFLVFADFLSYLLMNEFSQTSCIAAGIFIANISSGMNLRDFFIIYLACGAPFGVYYFLQNRNRLETKILWLKSLIRFVFWIPLALQMVARKSLFTNLYSNNFDKTSNLDAKKEFKIDEIKKSLENFLTEAKIKFSIFEFREIFDRYVGLTEEINNEAAETSPPEKEVFRITNHTNKNLAEICLHRRNRNRLSFHQKLARRDFFEAIGKFTGKIAAPQNLFNKISELADMLNDSEAQILLEKLSKESLQTEEKLNVRNLENELWNSEKHKPHQDSKTSTNMQALTATANLSPRKD